MKQLRWFAGAMIVGSLSCGPPHWGSDEVDAVKVPVALQDDYALFAQRCSKCHSLARPLSSGIDDDEYWKRYVERMRKQPSSGISPDDEPPILRFLHYYSEEQKRKKGARL
jgi:hypothetical protein